MSGRKLDALKPLLPPVISTSEYLVKVEDSMKNSSNRKITSINDVSDNLRPRRIGVSMRIFSAHLCCGFSGYFIGHRQLTGDDAATQYLDGDPLVFQACFEPCEG